LIMLSKQEVKRIVEENGLDASWEKKLLDVSKKVAEKKISKSAAIVELSDVLYRGDLGKVVGCSYNMVFNVLDSKGLVGKKKADSGSESKSARIRALWKEGYEVKDICKVFAERYRQYVNYNFVRSVVKKAEKEAERTTEAEDK